MIHGNEELFAGLDVAMNRTSLCLVDASGDVIWRGACTTDPESLAATIRRVGADRSARIGLETGSLSPGYANRALRPSALMPGMYEPRFPAVPTRAMTLMRRASRRFCGRAGIERCM